MCQILTLIKLIRYQTFIKTALPVHIFVKRVEDGGREEIFGVVYLF